MEEKNNLSVLLVSKGKESPRYIDLNLKHIKYGIALLVVLIIFSASSLYYSFKLYSLDNIQVFSEASLLDPETQEQTTEYNKENELQGITSLINNPEDSPKESYGTLAGNIGGNADEDLITIINHHSDGTIEYETQTKEEALEEKLIEVEKKLIDMQEVLKKKGINKSLSIGGPYIPADRMSHDYMDAVKKDIENLSKTFESYPIGSPLRGRISSGFGYRKDPFHRKIAFHSGIDIGSIYGTKVISTAKGTVVRAGWCKGYGKCVVIRHSDGYRTLYGHLSRVSVKSGEKVESGQTIGKVGSSGRSTGPHLHYEVIKNRKKLDPKKYLNMG